MKIPGITIFSSILVGALLVVTAARADFKQVGTATQSIETIRSSDISRSCAYRLRGMLPSPTGSKWGVYQMGFQRETTSTTATGEKTTSFLLEGFLSYSELSELISLTPSAFISYKPSVSPTIAADSSDQIRIEIFSSQPARVSVVSRGSIYKLQPSLFILESDCGPWSPSVSPITGNGSSVMCPGLSVRAPGYLDTRCECPFRYNEMTAGSSTPCTNLGYKVFMCEDGSFGAGLCGASAPEAKEIGLVGAGLGRSYVFDYQTCSCKLCNPWFYKRSLDQRSCECRYNTAADVVSFRNTQSSQLSDGFSIPSFPVDGDSCTTLSVSGSGTATHTLRAGVIFDPRVCACVYCPSGKRPNADSSACI